MVFLRLAFITAPGNFYGGFHISHERLKAKLIIPLENKPDAEEMKLADFFFQYIVAVETKVILHLVMYHCPVSVIFNMQ